MAKIKPTNLVSGFYGGLKPALLELSIKDFIIELAKPEVIELIKCIDRFNLAA